MGCIKTICLLILFCGVTVSALGVNDADVPTTNGGRVNNDEVKPRFMDFDGLITSAMSGMDIKVNNYVSHGSSSVVKKVTQSHSTTTGGQTIVKTEITEVSGNNNYPVGFRFKRNLLEDFRDKVENKADIVKHKLAGAVADGVNLAHSGMNKVKDFIQQEMRN